jgi:glycosyltransferase involved in cell wall biosynthesis
VFSLVIPVYRNEENVPSLLAALEGLAAKVPGALEVVFVVDGSPDKSFQVLRERLPAMPFTSKLVAHSRNFGAFAAIRTGLAAATGSYFAVMAADLQEPIELIQTFFQILSSGEAEVVYGERVGRSDPLLSKLASTTFWALYSRLINPQIPEGGVDIFGCNRAVLTALLRLDESNSSLVAQLFWVGFRRRGVPYERRAREIGTSAWTFRKKLRYLSDSVYSFTDLPVRVLTSAGVFTMAVAVVGALVVLISRLTGHISVSGYTPTVLAVAFFGGLNAFGLGVIGEYVWRTFENTKHRPSSLVVQELDFAPVAKPVSAEKAPRLEVGG